MLLIISQLQLLSFTGVFFQANPPVLGQNPPKITHQTHSCWLQATFSQQTALLIPANPLSSQSHEASLLPGEAACPTDPLQGGGKGSERTSNCSRLHTEQHLSGSGRRAEISGEATCEQLLVANLCRGVTAQLAAWPEHGMSPEPCRAAGTCWTKGSRSALLTSACYSWFLFSSACQKQPKASKSLGFASWGPDPHPPPAHPPLRMGNKPEPNTPEPLTPSHYNLPTHKPMAQDHPMPIC